MYINFNNVEHLNEFLRTLDSKIRYIINSQYKNEKLLENLKDQSQFLASLVENPSLIYENIENVIKVIHFYQSQLEKHNGTFNFKFDMIREIYNGYFEIDTMDIMAEHLKLFKEHLDKIQKNTIIFLKKQQYFKNKTISVFNMLKLDESGNLIIPIENKSSLNLINSVMIDCNYKTAERNMILMDINHLNLKALQERNRLLEIRKNELLKKEAKSLLIGDKKIVIGKIEKDISSLPTPKRKIVEKLITILEENNEFISLGYSEDIIAGYEILKNEKPKNYFIDSDAKIVLGIILRDIQEFFTLDLEKVGEEVFSEFQNAIDAYDECILLIQKENEVENEYQNFLNENDEIIALARACAKKFMRLKERLLPADLNIIKSIDAYIDEVTKQIDEDSKDEYEQITGFVENLTAGNQRLNNDVYYQYKKLEVIANYYSEFEDTQDIEFKKMIFIEMSQAIEDYIQYTANELNNDDMLEPPLENQNNVIYLMSADGENLLLKYAEKDNINYTQKNYETMVDFVKQWILDRNEVDIFLNSRKVKDSLYDESIRRLRMSEYRLVYINLNTIGNMKIQLDKSCYVVIAIGKKSGDFDIYKFANSTEVKQALQNLHDQIINQIEQIDKSNLSSEQKAEEKNKFIESYIATNNELFRQMLNEHIKKITSGSSKGVK